MNAKGAFCVVMAIGLHAAAQTNTIQFTNRIATFTDVRGRQYDRVQLIRADMEGILYRTVGVGGGRIYYTNLTPATLEQLGIPTNRIELAVENAERRKQQRLRAIAEEREANQREQARFLNVSNWISVKIDWVDIIGVSAFGGVRACIIRTENGTPTRVYMKGVPERVTTYYTQRQKLAEDVERLATEFSTASQRLRDEEYQWKLADAATPRYAAGDFYWVNAILAERFRIDQWGIQLQAAKEQLAEQQRQLEYYQDDLARVNAAEEAQTTVRAFVTRHTYNGLPVLECMP